MKTLSPLDTIHSALEALRDEEMNLRHVANNLRSVGLEMPAAQILESAVRLLMTENALRTSVHKLVDESFQAAQQSSHNMLHAALAGIELGKKERN